jgi:hypothetical protein
MIGWDYVSELRPPTDLLFILRWYVSVESHGGDDAGWVQFLTHPPELCGSRTSRLPGQFGGIDGRWSENFACQYVKYLKGALTCRKILRHGTSGFTSHPKEGVLRIFIALKNPSPGLNSRPLGPMASTLTTTPPVREDTVSTAVSVALVVLISLLKRDEWGRKNWRCSVKTTGAKKQRNERKHRDRNKEDAWLGLLVEDGRTDGRLWIIHNECNNSWNNWAEVRAGRHGRNQKQTIPVEMRLADHIARIK